MSGNKSDYKAATFRLPPDILRALDEYSARTGTVKGFIVEQALRQYLEQAQSGGRGESDVR